MLETHTRLKNLETHTRPKNLEMHTSMHKVVTLIRMDILVIHNSHLMLDIISNKVILVQLEPHKEHLMVQLASIPLRLFPREQLLLQLHIFSDRFSNASLIRIIEFHLISNFIKISEMHFYLNVLNLSNV